MEQYTPEKLKSQIMLFSIVLNSVTGFLPSDIARTIKDIVAVTVGLASKQISLELLCYLINAFQSGVSPSREELSERLSYFAKRLQESNE